MECGKEAILASPEKIVNFFPEPIKSRVRTLFRALFFSRLRLQNAKSYRPTGERGGMTLRWGSSRWRAPAVPRWSEAHGWRTVGGTGETSGTHASLKVALVTLVPHVPRHGAQAKQQERKHYEAGYRLVGDGEGRRQGMAVAGSGDPSPLQAICAPCCENENRLLLQGI